MEITGRDDLGANLAAPQTDERGEEYVGYTLVREVHDGDVVFTSTATSARLSLGRVRSAAPTTAPIVWAARGTSFRQHGGGEAYERPGWFFNLEGPYPLDEPVTLAWLRSHEDQVRAVRATLASTYPGMLYFPFAVSDRRPLRAAQTYMAKFPAGLVSRVPTLAAVGREATTTTPLALLRGHAGQGEPMPRQAPITAQPMRMPLWPAGTPSRSTRHSSIVPCAATPPPKTRWPTCYGREV
jgi:hypothetical protein